jgi:hypothetical protein
MASPNKHLQELLQLPLEDRAYAARRLLESLDDEPPDSSAEELRAAERLRRATAVADGTVFAGRYAQPPGSEPAASWAARPVPWP